MTKSNASIFGEFYEKIKSAELVAPKYNVSLTETTTGAKYEFEGTWGDRHMVTITAGRYKVEGKSTASGGLLQEKCSLVLVGEVSINAASETILLPAQYDCFLLIFNATDIVTLQNVNGESVEPFFEFGAYKYAFVNGKVYSDDQKATSHILGQFSDDCQFKVYTGNLNFEKGKYYVYNSLAGGFYLPEMEDGTFNAPNGARFTVAPGKTVKFAPGNLVVTYKADGNHLWEFEKNQWDYSIGDNASYSVYGGRNDYGSQSNYEVGGTRISHFGWGTSGIGSARPPYDITADYSLFTWSDWGKHFDDAGNGDNSRTDGTWYTLSDDEWKYLIYTRDNYAVLIGKGKIHVEAENKDVSGLFILPDNWVMPSGCQFTSGTSSRYTTNAYTTGSNAAGYSGKWPDMEAAGAVFLPAAGFRDGRWGRDAVFDFFHGSNDNSDDHAGDYWSSSVYDGIRAYSMQFNNGSVGTAGNERNNGISVRLVHD